MKKIYELPKTWEEFCNSNSISVGEAYINMKSRVEVYETYIHRDPEEDKYILPSEEAAKAHLAYMQLHQLRDKWRQGWKPFSNGKELFFTISRGVNDHKPVVVSTLYYGRFLSFPTKDLAEYFLYNYRDLIEQAGDLI